MAIDNKIRDEKHGINRNAEKISVLSSNKIEKYEHLTGKEILPSDQSRVIEQAGKFTYSPLRKALEKQAKTIEDYGKKQIEALKILEPTEQKLAIKDAIPEDQLNEETKNKIEKIKRIWKK